MNYKNIYASKITMVFYHFNCTTYILPIYYSLYMWVFLFLKCDSNGISLSCIIVLLKDSTIEKKTIYPSSTTINGYYYLFLQKFSSIKLVGNLSVLRSNISLCACEELGTIENCRELFSLLDSIDCS